jgi:2-polyprenyl-3-methyl-5-hydroxy-6-metoxy-1,4-benzoquinol methylase
VNQVDGKSRIKDIITTFSGSVANEWEAKGSYIKKIVGDDNKFLEHIAHHVTPRSRIIEIGCGTGKLLQQIDRMYTVQQLVGLEPSADMAGQLKARTFRNPLTIVVSSLSDYRPQGAFDLILLKQVLHHVPDPASALVHLDTLLGDGGRIVLMVPNEHHQREIVNYTPEGDPLGRMSLEFIRSMLEQTSLKVLENRSTTSLAFFEDLNDYFWHLHSIGSLQKMFNYSENIGTVRQFLSYFKSLLGRMGNVRVTLGYSYYVLGQEV